MASTDAQARLRALPAIDALLAEPWVRELIVGLSRPVAVAALREAVGRARERIRRGEPDDFSQHDVRRALEKLGQSSLRRVLNFTGVVLHTNLGRAPLAERARARLAEAAGYCNVELELDEGARSHRSDHVRGLFRALTGAESAVVVNNGAAAVLLVLSALGQGREAVVSRGELVEIGGGFRVPDVMRASGVALVEVGTTNRTRIDDYAAHVGERTALLTRVHRSNFALVGFTESPTTTELAGLAREKGLVLFDDLGSGALVPLHGDGLPTEPTVGQLVAQGSDLVAFSGDKLLGGPQCGVVVGKAELVERLERHPLMRAVRVDKLTLAALEATLELYRDGVHDTEVPVRALATQPLGRIQARATALADALNAGGVPARVVDVEGKVGGGAMPLAALPSKAVALGGDAVHLHERLRAGNPAILGRLGDSQLLLDVRCVFEDDISKAAAAVLAAVRSDTC